MLETGQQLGEFEILGLLGKGGMGAVYKARQTTLRRLVALKLLQPSLASDESFITRFHNEAVAAAGLNHPNLVQVYAAGRTGDLHWFAMEFVDGEPLQSRLDRLGKIDAAEAIAVVMHVANALEYGWRKARLIHRDHFYRGVRHHYFFSAAIALRLNINRHGNATSASRHCLCENRQHIAREYWRFEFNLVKKNRDPAMQAMLAGLQVCSFVDQA